MNKYLIFVKHSLPEIQEDRLARDWHLSAEGRLRAGRLASRLTPYEPEVLISSIELKARETAEIIATVQHLNVHTFENLHEHDRSDSSFLPKMEFQSAVRHFFMSPETLNFGKETANESHHRFSKAVHSVLETYRNKTVIVVSHGTVITLFVSRLLEIPAYSLWKTLGLPSFLVLRMSPSTLIAQENIT